MWVMGYWAKGCDESFGGIHNIEVSKHLNIIIHFANVPGQGKKCEFSLHYMPAAGG